MSHLSSLFDIVREIKTPLMLGALAILALFFFLYRLAKISKPTTEPVNLNDGMYLLFGLALVTLLLIFFSEYRSSQEKENLKPVLVSQEHWQPETVKQVQQFLNHHDAICYRMQQQIDETTDDNQQRNQTILLNKYQLQLTRIFHELQSGNCKEEKVSGILHDATNEFHLIYSTFQKSSKQ